MPRRKSTTLKIKTTALKKRSQSKTTQKFGKISRQQ
jgi:hypothetical protein